MTTTTLERPQTRPMTPARLRTLFYSRPDFTMDALTEADRRDVLTDIRAGRIACCWTSAGLHVWRLRGMGR